MAKLMDAEQTRGASERSRAYTDASISGLAGIMAGALADIEEAEVRALTAGAWKTSGGQVYCDIAVPDMTARTIVHVSVPEASAEAADECGLSWRCESRQGALRLFADQIPASSFAVDCAMVQPAEKGEGT